MKCSLTDRVAVVTGASQGLGRGIALALADAGAAVAVHHAPGADRAAELVVAAIAGAGGKAAAFGGDLRDPTVPARVARQVVDRFGRIDVLVNNAGATTEAPVAAMSLEEWQSVIAVNLTAVFLMSQAVLPDMIKRRWGRIISISSNIGHRGAVNLGHYAAAKAGVMAFTRCLALEAVPFGVVATSVAPGPIETEMFRSSSATLQRERLSEIPLNRPATIDEIVATVLLLASDQGAYYVGQTLNPNGGHIML
jgi:3-oxoacyl-[acyl-carrier protein] reductase